MPSQAKTIKVNQDNVITVDGTSHLRSNCRKIKDSYYLIGDVTKKDSGQCYNIDDVYYICVNDSSRVQWNHSINQYSLKKDLIYGIINKNGQKGYFNPDFAENIPARDGNDYEDIFIMNDTCIPPSYAYDFADGKFKPKNCIQFSIPIISERNKPQYATLNANVYGYGDDAQGLKNVLAVHNEHLKKMKPSVFDKYFHNYTYGLEIETDAGFLPERFYYLYGALPLKDGSIYSTEITTIPYKNKYFNNIALLANEINKHCIATYNNSLHVNIGNVPNTPQFRVAVWILYCRIQSEIENMMPAFKRSQRFFAEKRGQNKDHCRIQENLGLCVRYGNPTSEIPQADRSIKKFLNEGSNDDDYVRTGAAKWDQRSRYYALNMMPMYFGSVPRVEFRLHSGTTNPIKTLLWTLLCGAIVKYAAEQSNIIFEGRQKITLNDIIEYSFLDDTDEGLFLANYMEKYIKKRTDEHISAIEKDRIYEEYASARGKGYSIDNEYVFTINGISILDYENKRS